MSKVDKKVKKQEEVKEQKSEGLLKTIFSEETMVEDPQDIIDKDPDVNRKNAFLKAYETILALFPEAIIKKKKKSKEKEKFDRDLSVREMNRQDIKKKEKEKEKENDEREDKGMERE